jgi:cation diffusion facilitator family transporter
MAEGVHSVADSGNQALLLLGAARAKKTSDKEHPLGYARETYFWAMLVAIILFVLGGAYSLYEGVHKLEASDPLTDPGWAVGVLIFGILLEGYSLRAAWMEYEAVRGSRSLMRWSRTTGRVNLLVVVFEDLAATAGLIIALIAVVLSWLTGNPLYDALGTCVIGVLLLIVAVFLASLVRRLIIGLSVDDDMKQKIISLWEERDFEVLNMFATWHGPGAVNVALKVRPTTEGLDANALMTALNEVEAELQDRHPEIGHVFVEPDLAD